MTFLLFIALGAAQPMQGDPAIVTARDAAEAKLQAARYAWHECVTIEAMNEVAAGEGPGSMSLATENCEAKEDAVQQALFASLSANTDDGGFAMQQMEEWRVYETRWAQMMLKLGAEVPKPKVFRYRR